MFSNLKPKTAIFIDYSNIFYAKYTVWWHFSLENFLDICEKNENISFVWVYWAFDNKNPRQCNWHQKIK